MTPYVYRQYIRQCVEGLCSPTLALSRKNCHVQGLHSIVLDRHSGDDQLVRLYMTTEDHLLHENSPGATFINGGKLSLGIHGHHCSLELCQVYGETQNRLLELLTEPDENDWLGYETYKCWKYESALGPSGTPGFVEDGMGMLQTHSNYPIGIRTFMRAEQLHTVYVQPGAVTAWLVVEQPDSKGKYSGRTWSNADLTQFKPENHYQKFKDLDEVRELLSKIGV